MLGNDIVDLQLAVTQSNWRRKGFLEKIFTEQEQILIKNATDQEQMVWLLWSMKESAYKIVSSEVGERFYQPRSLECFVDYSQFKCKGKVVFEDFKLKTITEITTNFINTTATSELNCKIEHYLLNNPKNYIAEFNKLSNQYRLTKDETLLPIVQDMFTEEFCPASVSHHGRYVSIVHPTQFEPV